MSTIGCRQPAGNDPSWVTGNLESGAMADQPKKTGKKGATKRSAKAPAISANGNRNGAKAAKPKAAASKPRRKAPRAKGLESFDPATGELLGAVSTIGPGAVESVVGEVSELQRFWAQLPVSERARYIRRTADVVLAESDRLARLLSQEQGKPIVESYTMELIPSVDGLRWIADEGQRLLADEKIPMRSALFASKSSKFAFEPVGVIGVIAPWNYPWSIPLTEVAIALMAGNGVVLKPASLTPLIGEEVRKVFERAGLPQGLVRTVHGGGRIGDALVKSKAEKIFFTGSVEVGRKVGVEAAKRLKGAVLELGGKDPMIVCSDADLKHTIPGAIWGAFANGGQTCAGIERAYVVESVADRFIEGVVSKAQAMRVGNPMSWDTEIGPMTSESQADLVEELIADAVAHGAEMRCGGAREVAGLSGRFIAPTVLTGVTHEMRIMKEEIFGPVLPILRVPDETEALRLANDSEFGLGASVWTRDREKGERIARRLEAGMAWINDHAFTHGACQCAWSGVKDSGVGISHSKFGFYECVNVKTITYEPGLTRDFWWHPYDETLGKAVRASGKILYGSPAERRTALRSGLGSLIEVGRRTLRG